MKHTSTPWKLSEKHGQFFKLLAPSKNQRAINPMNGHEFIDTEPQIIARISAGPVLGEEGDANAAFIVTACNAHEPLVEAARRSLSDNALLPTTRKMLTEALAKAGITL